MKSKTTRALLTSLVAATLTLGQVAAQQLLPGERAAAVAAIPGVIAAGATWELIWAGFQTADGIVGTPDGGVLESAERGGAFEARPLSARDDRAVSHMTVGGHRGSAASCDCRAMRRQLPRRFLTPDRPLGSGLL